MFCAGLDRDAPACRFAQGTDHFRSFHRLPADGRNAQQLALGVRQQVRQADGVIDIAPDVGVQKDFAHKTQFVLSARYPASACCLP